MTEHAIELDAPAHAHAHPSYVKIWGILLALLIVSVLGPELEIPAVTRVTAFGIAIIKAYLVVRFFMHVNVEPRYIGFLLVPMLGFVLLFFQGISEIIKKIAVMRGLIPDPFPATSHHAPLEIDPGLAAQAGFADPDHPLTDLVDDVRKEPRK